MPRKKIVKKSIKKVGEKTPVSNSRFKLGESYVSLFLGAFVVFVIAILGFSSLKMNAVRKELVKETSSTHTELSVPQVIQNENSTPGGTYTVKSGDDLWSISEKIYKSGYNWVDIARANNITNPGLIYSGMKLSIPNEKPIIVQSPNTVSYEGMSQAEGAIFGPTYTVAKGDSLWSIAVRAYGDGYKYVDLVKANNLSSPSLIFSGNVLKIPRQ